MTAPQDPAVANVSGPIVTSVTTAVTHKVTIDAPVGEHFVITSQRREETMAASRITYEVFTDGNGVLNRIGIRWIATGYGFKVDGTVGRAKRTAQGSNPIALPPAVRLAAIEALRKQVGTLHDPDRQLDGWEGIMPPSQRASRA